MGNPLASDSNEEEEFGADELAPGTELLRGQYIIESFLNAGGFGITYLAKDSLERKVVIKECFPGSFCRRSRMIVHARSRAHQAELKSIVRLFVQEARSLAKLIHPNIVGVHQVFEDNDTAYMALDFVEGRDLLDTLEDPNHGLKPDQITRILRSMLDAVGFIHDQGMLHRDISPDNILLDGAQRPVLIDFGAAREEATKKSRVLSAMRVVKDGYSPQEFYISGSEQTPSSDLYALGATFYHLITGEAPPNSQTRLASLATGESDPYQNLAENHTDNDYDKNVLRSIDMALAVLPKDRVQSAQDWLNIIDGVEGDNITALRPTSGSNAAAAAASEAAAKPKSKVGLLLASVAAVALIGVGVISSGVLDSTPAVEVDGATATTPAIEEPVQSAEIAPIIEEAASTPTDEAVAEAEIVPETVETPGVDTAEIAPDVVAPEAAETQDSSLTEEAAPVVVDTAATDSADGTPADVAENPAKTAEELLAAGEIELVEETSITDADVTGEEEIALLDDTSTSDTPVEAETNLAKTAEELLAAGEIELVEETSTTEADVTSEEEIALLDDTSTSDTPVEAETNPAKTAEELLAGGEIELVEEEAIVLPDPSTIVAPDAPAEPDLIATLSLPTAQTPQADAGNGPIVAPENLTDGITNAFATADGIEAIVPGAEIVEVVIEPPVDPAVTIGAVVVGWSVGLPFTGSEDSPTTIDEIAQVAPEWAEAGLEVVSVNDTPIADIADADYIVSGSIGDDAGEFVSVNFGVKSANGDIVQYETNLPVTYQTKLTNGMSFESKTVGDEWQTFVASLPAGDEGEIRVGDQIVAYIPTSERISEAKSMQQIINREVENDVTQFSFAVVRDGQMWVASLNYSTEPQG